MWRPKKTFKSFKYAFVGLGRLAFHENNAKFHALATLVVLVLSVLLKISPVEWCIVLIQVGMVWAAESFNTAIEKLADKVEPRKNEKIGAVKDMAAAAVLVSSLIAAIIGTIIFVPKILTY